MEINLNNEKRIVYIWLTNAEKNNPAVKAKLDQLYAQYRQKKYMVVTFMSGDQPLQPSIVELLKYNSRKSAEVAIDKAK